jgi:hypothetical protein
MSKITRLALRNAASNLAELHAQWKLDTAALKAAEYALEHAEKTCPYHGRDFTRAGMWRGIPRCESCRQPWRVVEGLAAIEKAWNAK